MKFVFALAVLAVPVSSPVMADDLVRIGNFEVRTEKDRFGDQDTVIATTISGGSVLAVRCLGGQLSLAFIDRIFGQGRWEEGMTASVKIKVDAAPVIEASADGINDKAVEIGDIDTTINSMSGAGEIALRITAKDISQDHIFRLKQSAKALKPVLAACAQQERKKGQTAESTPAKETFDWSEKATAPEQTPVGATPSPAPPPTAPLQDANTLPTAAIEQIDRMATIMADSAKCDRTYHADKVGDAVKKALPTGQIFDGRQFALGLARYQQQLQSNMTGWSDRAAEDKKKFCDAAASSFGPSGTLIDGALD